MHTNELDKLPQSKLMEIFLNSAAVLMDRKIITMEQYTIIWEEATNQPTLRKTTEVL